MINTASLIGFVLTAGILLIIPGPTILTVVAYGLRVGRKAVWASTAGVVLGDLTAVTLCLTGLGALLAVSPVAYDVIKWAGVAYLVYVSVQTWRESNRVRAAGSAGFVDPEMTQSVPLSKVFQQTFIVTALNPKGIVFFLAFIPQFVDRALAYWPQVMIYGGLFVVMGGANALAYAYSSGRLSSMFTHPDALKWLKRVSAGFLSSAALITALHNAPNP